MSEAIKTRPSLRCTKRTRTSAKPTYRTPRNPTRRKKVKSLCTRTQKVNDQHNSHSSSLRSNDRLFSGLARTRMHVIVIGIMQPTDCTFFFIFFFPANRHQRLREGHFVTCSGDSSGFAGHGKPSASAELFEFGGDGGCSGCWQCTDGSGSNALVDGDAAAEHPRFAEGGGRQCTAAGAADHL